MTDSANIKSRFTNAKSDLFKSGLTTNNAFRFCINYSLLIEEYIRLALNKIDNSITLASAGSFSRRELSPFSDIDIMFIAESVDQNKELIQKIVAHLWDCGIEVSHTVRDFSDLPKLLGDDLHSITQFFETRYLMGSKQIYNKWNKSVLEAFDIESRNRTIKKLMDDIELRHQKYGSSPKVLEPNVKFSAGGLRDIHSIEWINSLFNNCIISDQSEITQTEVFFNNLLSDKEINNAGAARLHNSYQFILQTRNFLHLIHNRKVDRLEFSDQEKISELFGEVFGKTFMQKYFESANIINRFSWTMKKSYEEKISKPLPSNLIIELDDDFTIKGNVISFLGQKSLKISEILRAFFYRGLHNARFDRSLRSLVIESVCSQIEINQYENSSVFFREILCLPQNVGKTLYVMNELGVLGAYIPEFKELIGFFQPGVYHCYSADEHTLIALINLEKLESEENQLGNIFSSIQRKDILFLAVLFHDIAKPISISGHEIVGAEISALVMERLGYSQDEINQVKFLVMHHLTMEQTAFRRNINDPSTLNNFSSLFSSIELLEMLYLLTYADLSAVNSMVWTNWKSELLYQLYRKTRAMLEEKISGEELLYSDAMKALDNISENENGNIKEHIESINDYAYLQTFSSEEINIHLKEIETGKNVSVSFFNNRDNTIITVIAKDSPSLLSRLCGAISINDLNILSAKIFTRKDGIVIDSFSVSDFRTSGAVEESRFEKISRDIELAITNQLPIGIEFNKARKKWWRLENRLFRRKSKIKIKFEDHDKYTIIDVYSPDCLGLLYQITRSLNELGLSIYFAKIATKSDDIVDAFYVLDYDGNKVNSERYELITLELTKTIEELL